MGLTHGAIGVPWPIGSGDVFVSAFSSTGATRWQDTFGTTAAEQGRAIAVGPDGKLYVTGLTYGNMSGVQIGQGDIFVTATGVETGVVSWTRQLGTSGVDQGTDVAASSDALFVSASTGSGLDGNVSAGGVDLALIKYGFDGTKQWTRQHGTSSLDYGYAVAVDTAGNAYVAGSSELGLDGNASAGGTDAILVKYDGAGQKLWTRQVGSTSYDVAMSVAVDASGNAYIAGYTSGQVDGVPGAGGLDAFLVKYNSAGQKQWTRMLGSTSTDTGQDVCVDGSGNVYVVGYAGAGFDGQVALGGGDGYLTKFDSAGTKQWTRLMGSSLYDPGAKSVAMQGAYIIVAGSTNGALPGKTSAGGEDIFLVRYDSAGNQVP